MRPHLMFRDADFDMRSALPWNGEALTLDLDLDVLWEAMAGTDKFLLETAKHAMLAPLYETEAILYRQQILDDCLRNPQPVRDLYAIAVAAIDGERRQFWGIGSKFPSSILRRAIAVMRIFVPLLRQLRQIAETNERAFRSEGMLGLFALFREQLSEAYLVEIEQHLRQLDFDDGLSFGARLGEGDKGAAYELLRTARERRNWLEFIFPLKVSPQAFRVDPRDESGHRALSELTDRSVNTVAAVLSHAADHVLAFFNLLRAELAFYLGCLNLHARLESKGEARCMPEPLLGDALERRHDATALYDPCLSLQIDERIVGNDLKVDGARLVVITGANRGGKSSFLRAIGVAQLMMQCGMFVPAEHFAASLCRALFTHYRREEDATMTSGKLDEELARMSGIVDHARPHSLLLLNESFSATNEREGSQIAEEVVSALAEAGIRVFFVTHLYEFASRLSSARDATGTLFLQAERLEDGTRTFKMVERRPLPTSYGADLYAAVFEKPATRSQ